jgi:hypothetical protein
MVVTVGGVASNKITFTVGTPPTISYTNPVNGPVGTSVTIVGNYFGATQGSSTVTFNGISATATSWSNAQVVAPVPNGATTGPVVVTVGGAASNKVNFTVGTPPTISYTSPVDGPVGTSVTIVGNYFGTTPGTVTFNGIAATPASWSNTQIVVSVPSGALTGPVVVTAGGITSNSVNFIVGTPPTISYSNPVDGPVGTSVSIVGNYFGSTQGSSTITFNGTTATPTRWSNTQIVVPVPSGASTGLVTITVGGMASNRVNFIVGTPPTISYTNPATAPVGNSITVVGNYFSSSQGSSTITFNGISATPTSWSNTQVVVPVPAGASTGPLVATVGGMTGNRVNFTVPPAITNVNPASGPVGTSITITGTSFGLSQGTSSITFNGMSATPTSWSAGTIVVPVPAGAASGNIVVTVGEVASAGANFTVATLTSVSLTPATASIAIGRTLQFALTGTYSDGTKLNVSSSATWSSSSQGLASINASGLATAAAVGQIAIQAAIGSLNASANLGVVSQTLTGSLPTTLDSPTLTLLLDGTVLEACGADSNGNPLASASIYDPNAGTFTPTGSLSSPRYVASATLLSNGQVLIAGGASTGGTALASTELYNPATGTFSSGGNLVTARSGHTATLLPSGLILIVGGDDINGSPLNSADLFNPVTGTSQSTGNLNTGRDSHAAVLLNDGTVLIAGGIDSNGNILQSAEIYNPGTGSFTVAGNMLAPRALFRGILLNNGSVLLTGGVDSSKNSQTTAELYNPSSRTFAATGGMNSARSFFAGTLLNNGTLLVAGGLDASGNVLGSAELYDPVAATFTPTSNSITPRYVDSAVLLANGNVLEVGGLDSNFNRLASAELYQPSSLAPPSLVSISTSPANPTISAGVTQAFVASGTFGDGTTQTLASVTWSSSSISVATITTDVTNRGNADAQNPGSATISACTGSICGSTSLTVSGPSLISIALSPQNPTIPLGTTQQFSAVGSYSDGSILDLTSTVTWSSSSTATTVNSAGLVTGVSLGTSVIQASSGSVNSSTNITIGAPALVTIALSPTTATIAAGTTQQYQVIGAYSDGSIGNLTNLASWFVVPSETASISGSGLATGIGPGTATITVVSGSVFVTGSLIVQAQGAPSLVSISVAPNQSSIPTGSNQQFVATGNYSDGSTQDLTASVTWISSRTVVTSISSSGLATATSLGNSTLTATFGSISGSATISVTTSNLGLNTSRYQHSSTLLNNGSVLFAGGVTCATVGSCTYLNSAELYNPNSGTITYTGSLTTPRSAPAVLLGNGKVLVAGGYSCDANGNCASLSSAEIYDPNSNSFSSAGNMTIDRYGHTMALLANGKVLIAGGETCSSSTSCNVLNTAELFDPVVGTFSGTGSLGLARYNASAAVLSSGQVLIAGGYNGSTYPAAAELYDPVAGTFSTTGSLNTPRANATASWLEASGNIVLIAGGSTCTSPGCPTASAEYYQNGYFYFLSNMSVPRLNQTATPLTNGQLFLAGGLDSCASSCVSAATSELYNPQTYSFASSQALTTGRSGHTATLLADGSVLLVGGINNGVTLASTDSYQPPSLALPQLSSIVISPSSSPAAIGSTLRLVANGVTDLGVLQPVLWTSSSPTVATVTNAAGSAGIVNALSAGTTTITASVGTISATAKITVTPVLVSITVTPPNPSTALNSAQLLKLRAVGNYSDGTSNNLTPYVKWTNSNSSVVTLMPNLAGPSTEVVLIPVGVGTANFSAAFGGLSGSVTVSVLAPPTVVAPSLANITPASGSAGTQVTITGSGFGASQGRGVVWLGTTLATVVSWSDSQVVASVKSGSTTGAAQIQQGGVASNPVPFTVNAATISIVTPTNGVPGTQVTITGLGFGATQGTGIIRLGNSPGVVTSWGDSQVVATVASGAASGTAQILQSGVWSNSVPFTINLPHIASITPNSGADGTAVMIKGNGFGTSQGGGVAWIGSTGGVVSSWSDTQVVATVAAGALSGIVKIQQNGTWSNAVTFTVPASGGASPVSLNPNVLTMQAGSTHSIQALDASGHSVTGLAWTSSNASVATLSTDDPPVITAVSVGYTTITAGNASADVTVFTGAALPATGTVVCSNPGDASGVISIMPAVPSPSGLADVFALQADGNVLAITNDCLTVWSASVGTSNNLIPDFQGGLVVTNGQSIYKLDGITGQAYPAYTSVSGSLLTPVIHTDGTIFTVDGDSVVGINPQTGRAKFNVQMDTSYTSTTLLDYGRDGIGACYSSPFLQGSGGTPSVSYSPPATGNLMIAGDGYLYVPYLFLGGTSVTESDIPDINQNCTTESTSIGTESLRLLKVGTQGDSYVFSFGDWGTASFSGPDGISQSAPLPSISWATPITNTDTGILLSWSVNPGGSEPTCPPGTLFASGCSLGSPTNLTLVSGGGVASQATVNFPIQPVLQRADGSYVGTDGTNMFTFTSAGTVLWTVPNETPQIATSDGGVIGASGVTYDQNGKATGQVGSLPTYSWKGAYQLGSAESIVPEFDLADIASTYASVSGGNLTGNGFSLRAHTFGLIFCNTGTGGDGPCPTSNPTVTPMQFLYLAGTPLQSQNYQMACDFSVSSSCDNNTAHPDWVNVIKTQALEAYKAAFTNLPAILSHKNVVAAMRYGGQNYPPFEHTVYVDGEWYSSDGADAPGLTKTKSYSWVFYPNIAYEAEFILGPYQNLNDFTPPFSDTTDMLKLVSAIGRGIGNTAAHETGHQIGFSVHLTGMECGSGAPANNPKDCQGGMNSVYESASQGEWDYLPNFKPAIQWEPVDQTVLQQYFNCTTDKCD